MKNFFNNLNYLNQQIDRIEIFQNLYEQSYIFPIFQSYVQYKNLIQYIYEKRQIQEDILNFNQYLDEFTAYTDSRICQCAGYVLTVYIKLVEYHTNLYNMYQKIIDDKHDYLCCKQFDRINYYRIEICQLLLRSNYLQRLLVEIENGRKFFHKFQTDVFNKETYFYKYQYYLTYYTYNLFEAIVLQRTRLTSDAKLLCEQSLNALNEINQEKFFDSLISNTDLLDCSSVEEKRDEYQQIKDDLFDISTRSPASVSKEIIS